MLQKYSDWLIENTDPSWFLGDPPLDAQLALDFLYEYLLPDCSERKGCGYITTMPERVDQVNSLIVYEILYRYSKDFRKELKQLNKRNKRKKR